MSSFSTYNSNNDSYHRMNEIDLSNMYWYNEVVSTMDTARELVKNHKNEKIFAVVTERQQKGRGTKGRSWQYGSHNLFLTIGVNRRSLPISLHLLPLRCGCIVSSAILPYIKSGADVKLKWPNDVLVGSRKISGMLIEMEDDFMLVGIGCNVMNSPDISVTGADGGRPATSILQHNTELESLWSNYLNSVEQKELPVDCQSSFTTGRPVIEAKDIHKQLAIDIFGKFHDWLTYHTDSNNQVIDDFGQNMDYSIQRLRESVDPTKRAIQPITLNTDGTLRIRYLDDGSEDVLAAEYLW